MTSLFVMLLALMQATPYVPARLERSTPFTHPPNIIASSWVVLDVEVDGQGNPRAVTRTLGENPFLDLATASVRGWTFSPARNPMPAESHVTVVFLFRAPNIFGGSPLQFKSSPTPSTDRAPLPAELVDPGHPVTSVGEGPTIVELQTGDAGNIEGSRVVSDTPGHAAYTEQALRSWKFQPAIREGKPTNGTVIGVVSYLRPVTTVGIAPAPGPTPPGPPPTPPPSGPGIIRHR